MKKLNILLLFIFTSLFMLVGCSKKDPGQAKIKELYYDNNANLCVSIDNINEDYLSGNILYTIDNENFYSFVGASDEAGNNKYIVLGQLDGQIYLYNDYNQKFNAGNYITVAIKYGETADYNEGVLSEPVSIMIKGQQGSPSMDTTNSYISGTYEDSYLEFHNDYCVVYSNGNYYFATQSYGEPYMGQYNNKLAIVSRNILTNSTAFEYIVLTKDIKNNLNPTNQDSLISGLTWTSGSQINLTENDFYENFSSYEAYIMVRKRGSQTLLTGTPSVITIKKYAEYHEITGTTIINRTTDWTIKCADELSKSDIINDVLVMFSTSYNPNPKYENATSVIIKDGETTLNKIDQLCVGKTLEFTFKSENYTTVINIKVINE